MLDLLVNAMRRMFVTALTAAMTLPGMAVGSAVAQDAGATATDTWIKICQSDEKSKKELCQTGYDLRTTTGTILASFVLMEMTGETRKIVQLVVPTGLLLQPGVKIQIDEGKAEDGKFGVCRPTGCFVQMVATEPFVAALKKGKAIVVGAQGQAANPVQFSFPLESYKSANEGKPIDEASFRKRQEAIEAQVSKKQQSFEDQLRDAQKKAQDAQ